MTAPVSSYKRAVYSALRIALYTTILATTEQVAIRLRLESEPTRTLRELVSRDCGLWLPRTGGLYSGLSACQPCCIKDLAPINRRLRVLLQPKSGIEPPSPATFNCGQALSPCSDLGTNCRYVPKNSRGRFPFKLLAFSLADSTALA